MRIEKKIAPGLAALTHPRRDGFVRPALIRSYREGPDDLAIHPGPLDRRAVCLGFVRSALVAGVAGTAAGCGQVGAARTPGALTIIQTEAPRGMDPANHTATLTGSILDPMYEGLVRQDAAGPPSPLLAASWDSSVDGLTWTFRLRDGVRFHDGAPLDAAAVVASFQRLIDPGSALAAAGKFRPIIGSVQALGADAVQFRLRKPYTDFLTLMAANQASIVSPRAAAAGTLQRAACGTGPFAFAAWASDEYVEQRRNPRYWGPPPRLETLRWTWSSEPSVLYMALRTGDADVAAPLSPVFSRLAVAHPGLGLVHAPGTAFFWIALNTRLAPFDDVRVRQALNYATDRAALVAGLLGGFGQPAAAPLASRTPFVHPDPVQLRFDPAYARRLLAETGRGAGLGIAVATQAADEPLAEALQAMWVKVGVQLEIRRLEGGVYAAEAFAAPSAKAADGLGGVLSSWSSGVVPDLQLRPLFDSASAAPAGANLGFYDDPAVDRLIDAAVGATNVGRRTQLYAAAQSRIIGAAPAVWLYTRDDLVGAQRGVSGLSIRPGGELIVSGAVKA
jgi:glutathione transport system substrate-binding protein